MATSSDETVCAEGTIVFTSDEAIAQLCWQEAEERAVGRALAAHERRADPTAWVHHDWRMYVEDDGSLAVCIQEAYTQEEHMRRSHRERVLACRRRRGQ